MRRDVDDAESDVLEAIEEHHVVKVLLRELEDLDAAHERFDAKVTVLMENVRHHVKEEEQELFPEVRDAIGRSELLELGAALLEQAKPNVPTRPTRGRPTSLRATRSSAARSPRSTRRGPSVARRCNGSRTRVADGGRGDLVRAGADNGAAPSPTRVWLRVLGLRAQRGDVGIGVVGEPELLRPRAAATP